MTCTLCNNPATYVGWAGDPETHCERVYVCGNHSLNDDERI